MSKPSRHVSVTFMLLSVTFCVCIIVSNLVEIKTVEIGKLFSVTAGMFVFPISYILNDCIVEVYGFAKARMVIWLGFAMNLLVALLLQLAILLPGSEEWHGQAAMEKRVRACATAFRSAPCSRRSSARVSTRSSFSR